MEAVKGESVLWTKSSTGLPFSYSPSSHPWPSSFGPFLFPSVVPFTKWYPLIGFQAQHFLYLLDSGLILQCIRCLLESISVVNSWFWRVKSAMAAAMDCTCWTEDGCMTGAYWRSRRGLLEASLLSWWPGFVALNLVQTIQPSIVGQITKKFENSSHRQRQLIMLRKLVGWMAWILMNLRAWKRRDTKSEETRVDRPQTLRWWS